MSIIFSLIATLSLARAELPLGQITSVSKDGIIEFFIGDTPIQVGEELRIEDSGGESRMTVRVNKVAKDSAEAEVVRVFVPMYGGYFERLSVHHRVKLDVKQNELKSFNFFYGGNSGKQISDYTGTAYTLGLAFSGYYKTDKVWAVRLQVDNIGKNPASISKQSNAYMIGTGIEINRIQYLAYLGSIERLTVNRKGAVGFDPYTGASIPVDKFSESAFGYMVSVSYRYDISPVSRNKNSGWSLSPQLTYANTFASTGYGGYTSLMLAADLWID